MKLPILILMICGIGFVLVVGCTNTASPPPAVTPTMVLPATPTVQEPGTPTVQETAPLPVSNTDTLCGELVYCGYAPAGFDTQPVTSGRCDQLYALEMQNDQMVLQCLKNPAEAGGTTSVKISPCMQGMGTVEDCARYGIPLDRDTGSGGSEINESKRDSSIHQTNDDGYVVSGGIDGKVSPSRGAEEALVIKLNPGGDLQWQKVLGGTAFESAKSIEQTTDEGYILTGITGSDNTGDVGPNHGGSDVWVVKLNPRGDIQWQKVLGGTAFESGNSIEQTSDDGYILAGTTDSDNTGDVGPSHGKSDIWVVKLNPTGIIQWQKVLGGTAFESAGSIEQTTDDGYILTGTTDSDDTGDVGPSHGKSDIWVVRLNPAGYIQWQKVLGGTAAESAGSIEQTMDDGYILTGTTDSDATGDVGPSHGTSDIWVVKLNPRGDILWQKVLGGTAAESAGSIEQATDNGYILTGTTNSDNTGDVGPNQGKSDIWVVKLNTRGDILWQKVLGGSAAESAGNSEQTSGGEYILTGITASDTTGDVGPNPGGSAIWVVKLNPAGYIQWQKVL